MNTITMTRTVQTRPERAYLGEQTEVTVRHTSTEDLITGGAQQGWNDCLDRLTQSTREGQRLDEP